MREAMGGSLLIYLFIPIIFMIIVFIGFIMNYASAYRAANYIVSEIEANQGLNETTDSRHYTGGVLASEYGYSGPVTINCSANGLGQVCVVTLAVEFDLPLIGTLPAFQVKAETKTLLSGS